jgi:predicted small lipoprotein YifL
MRPALIIPLLLALAACGQTGPLYLPDANVETPVEIHAPADADKKKDEEKKDTQPPPGG